MAYSPEGRPRAKARDGGGFGIFREKENIWLVVKCTAVRGTALGDTGGEVGKPTECKAVLLATLQKMDHGRKKGSRCHQGPGSGEDRQKEPGEQGTACESDVPHSSLEVQKCWLDLNALAALSPSSNLSATFHTGPWRRHSIETSPGECQLVTLAVSLLRRVGSN